jgi:hypothetical protein
LIYGGYTATRGIFTRGTGLWEIGDLENMGTTSLMITATTNECSGASLVNTAVVTAAIDSNPYNNEATASVNSTMALYCIYLPIIYKEPIVCDPYDFNDSPGGWPVDNKDQVQTDYTDNNEEYFIKRSIWGMRIVQAPPGYSNKYTVEVDIHWGDIGYEYGIIFGQSGSPVPTYAFGIGPDPNDPIHYRYRLFRILTYNSSNNSVTIDCITQPCWISSSISPNYINHLKVECDSKTIKLHVNGTSLPEHIDVPYSCAGQVGVFVQSSPGDPNASAYFDNFKVSCPSQSTQIEFCSQSTASPLSAMSIDLDWIE